MTPQEEAREIAESHRPVFVIQTWKTKNGTETHFVAYGNSEAASGDAGYTPNLGEVSGDRPHGMGTS